MPVRVGVIGVGRFGREHARVMSKLPGVTLVGVVDRQAERAREVAERCGTQAFFDYRELIGKVDAVSVASPTETHFEIGKAFLQQGIATLIEKPIARKVEDAEELVKVAGARGAVLQVGHIERFNPAFQAAAPWLRGARLIEAVRTSPFRFRSADIDVVLDVMIHDLDLILSVVPSEPAKVDAAGRPMMFANSDMAVARVEFGNGCVANLTASRVAAEAKRQLRAYLDDGFVSLDFSEKTCRRAVLTEAAAQALRAAPKTESPTDDDLKKIPQEFYRVEAASFPNGREPLEAELDAFVRAARREAPSPVPGEHAVRVMRVAAQIQREIREHRWK